MDPPLINEGSFTTANPSLAEIWPFNSTNNNNNNVNVNDNNNNNNNNNSINELLGLRMGSGGFGTALINDFIKHSRNDSINNINNGGGGGLIEGVRDGSIEESTVTEQSGSVCRKRRENFCEDDSSKLVSSTSSANELKESNGKRIKPSCSKDENGNSKAGGEASSAGGKPTEKPVEPPKDYIHVRARRGQATDSHSLAERARREKISERMKILQDLVPGCNKVIGKALVLDEIINYIQSLQRQVEFLSMKLEAVNSGMIPSINGFHSKEMNQLGVPSFDPMFGAQATREFTSATGGPQTEWLHMQLGGSFGTTS